MCGVVAGEAFFDIFHSPLEAEFAEDGVVAAEAVDVGVVVTGDYLLQDGVCGVDAEAEDVAPGVVKGGVEFDTRDIGNAVCGGSGGTAGTTAEVVVLGDGEEGDAVGSGYIDQVFGGASGINGEEGVAV